MNSKYIHERQQALQKERQFRKIIKLMLANKITVDELKLALSDYKSSTELVKERREVQQTIKKRRLALEKARAAKAAKKSEGGK